ncbi:hypothetical protein CEXT_768051 [Caerostris extrusa]|uniref:Uncharacterized protein n=1 Tax=Caerostris extrusa TaxID=172846 RepID=A0AAV4V1H2_CAEEX|nr:hypothetical protein CEXT_768051 [Caerostris extrusa]
MEDHFVEIWYHVMGVVFAVIFLACIYSCCDKKRSGADDGGDRQPNADSPPPSGEMSIPMTNMEEIPRRRCISRSNSDTDNLERDLHSDTPPPAYDHIPPPSYDFVAPPAYDDVVDQ